MAVHDWNENGKKDWGDNLKSMKRELSSTARYIIAKTNKKNSSEWLPLWMHLEDTAGIMEHLMEEWLPDSVKNMLLQSIAQRQLKPLARFLGEVHDIGKCTAVFQAGIASQLPDIRYLLEQDGIILPNPQRYSGRTKVPHALAGYTILLKYQCPEEIASIIGAHHGKPQDAAADPENQIEINRESYVGFEGDEKQWEVLWEEFTETALKHADFATIMDLPEIPMSCQVLLSGLLIMADWIASNPHYFPLISVEECGSEGAYPARIERGWAAVNLPEKWNPLCYSMDRNGFQERFGFQENEVQKAMIDAVQSCEKPGIFVLEAQMGVGKTEAALAAAELLGTKTGTGGLYFGLPTQATANGIFVRLLDWAQGQAENDLVCHGIRLAHGMAELNEDYQALFRGTARVDDETEGLIVHPWFNGRKQALLTDFVIGTVDQLLMAALKQKHVMLRHLGLAGKIVVIDECHAYDAYMNQYLDMALTWLGEYGVPVILLSATLPEKRREELIKAYLKERKISESDSWRVNRGYPLLTWTDGNKINQCVIQNSQQNRKVMIHRIQEEMLPDILERSLSEGGCAGVIVNTVSRAQKLAGWLKDLVPGYCILVYHAHFISTDRACREKELLEILGKESVSEQRERVIVVGTQVLEQSLDIDFDMLITDLCPMDLLLQRIGRLHRHKWRERHQKLREAKCYILGASEDELEHGSRTIYGEWLLLRTRDLLPNQMILPDNIPELVQETYKDVEQDCLQDKRYKKAWLDFQLRQDIQRQKARAYRVTEPRHSRRIRTMDNWLNTDIVISDQNAEAAVRDGDSSLEVLIMIRDTAGKVHFVPWMYEGMEVSPNHVPNEEDARKIAGQRLRLPWIFSKIINKVIMELEESNKRFLAEWQQSGWLQGELVLLLKEDLTGKLCGYQLQYSRETGLRYGRDENERDRV